MPTSLHTSLPAKPMDFQSKLPSTHKNEPVASSSTPPTPLCSICSHQYAKYTCPGCSTRTCSVNCSSTHKLTAACTGQRNKVAYVPMNEYGWGKMMDDYVFLEDVSRKVGDWGKEIVKGGYSFAIPNSRGRGDARGRGRGMRGRGRGGGGGTPKTKRDILKLQLEARDIDMDLLPVGMERRKINQSSWDFKKHTALLTIEFKFYRPLDPLAQSSQQRRPPFILLTHRNDTRASLISLLRSHIGEQNNSKKESGCPHWVKRLVHSDPDDPDSFANPQCVMPTQLDPIASRQTGTRTQTAYYSFDPMQTLALLLRHTHFVEFPTIEIWEDFQGTVIDSKGIVTQPVEERHPKRRRMNAEAGKLAIKGLLGEYGSDDEDREEPGNVLTSLGNYVGSDEEGMMSHADPVEGDGVLDTDADGLSDKEAETETDPRVLLELMRQAGMKPWIVEEEDVVDWEDCDGEELAQG
ncbi:hypothetical protein B0H34DRAFT_687517 [Crassisporium funariophilum]|nr:hypothetical protein B0H34DRAFT_687517 [Crassisporium funariophilum]